MTLRTASLAALVTAACSIDPVTEPTPVVATPQVAMPWERCPDIQLAPPDAAPLVWRDCGVGCRELDLSAESPHRFYAALGARTSSGEHLLGLTRDLDEAQELAVFRVGSGASDAPQFVARMTAGFTGCLARLRGFDARGPVIELAQRDASVLRRITGLVPRGESHGHVLGEDRSTRPPLETVIAGRRAQTTTRASLEVDGATVYTAPRGALLADLVAQGDAVLFTQTYGTRSALHVLDVAASSHVLVDAAGVAATDGRDLVWFQDDHGAPALYTSPFATRVEQLVPRRLRAAHQDYVDAGRAVVGDGFALHVERRRADPDGVLIVTRLVDGRSWRVPPRTGTRWGTPLWIDRGELAIVLDADADAVRAGHVGHGQSFGIVRLAIPELTASH